MNTIVVAGASSRIGKTSLACKLIQMFDNFSALKVTTVHKNGCPHNDGCNICHNLDADYQIIKEEEILNQQGKDTQRLKESGAKRVLWLKSKADTLKRSLQEALLMFGENINGLIIEGTSVLKYLKADLTFYIKNEKR